MNAVDLSGLDLRRDAGAVRDQGSPPGFARYDDDVDENGLRAVADRPDRADSGLEDHDEDEDSFAATPSPASPFAAAMRDSDALNRTGKDNVVYRDDPMKTGSVVDVPPGRIIGQSLALSLLAIAAVAGGGRFLRGVEIQ